eukprot:Hpha_TRINITY_DN14173_c0_g1::TRINITY_DN14173_c0_g1_i1::g.10562::m.10562
MQHQTGQKQDPASARASELAGAFRDCKPDIISRILDPNVVFDDITDRLAGPRAVEKALTTLCELAKPREGGQPILTLEPTRTDRDLKSARFVWSMYGLRFEDVVWVSSSLLITKIARTKVESVPIRSPEEKAAGKRFLLALIGLPPPSAAKTASGRASPCQIDNRQHTFPVLDFHHMSIDRPRDLLTVQPRSGKRYVPKQDLQSKKEQQQREEEEKRRLAELAAQQEDEERPEQIVIKGRSRDGESAAYAFDRSEMRRQAMGETDKEGSDDEILDLSDADRVRWEASAVKLQGNALTGEAKTGLRLEEILKRICVHAFYHLTWIDLSSNALTSIPDFSQFPLVVLYLHANKIDDPKEINKLKGLEELQSLTLFGNPIQDSVQNYKLTVLNMLYPRDGRTFSLKKFDFSVLSKDDTANMGTLHTFTTVAAQNNKMRRRGQLPAFGNAKQ